MATALILDREATLFGEQPQATRDCRRLPATLVESKRFSFLSFFFLLLALRMVADSECRPDTVDLAETYSEVKTLLQFPPDGG